MANASGERQPLPGSLLITVCDSCRTACCWHGIFYCSESKGAGLTDISVAELRKLRREHEDYWEHDHRAKEWRRRNG